MAEKQILVRVALGGDRSLSNSKTAVNIWVTESERKTLGRLEDLFFKIGKGSRYDSNLPTFHVMDFEGAER